MSCPSFCDLGKSARDVFKNGFNYGSASCNIAAKVKENFELGGNLKYNFDHRKTTGVATSQIKMSNFGKMIVKYSDIGEMNLQYFAEKGLLKDVDLNTLLSFNPANSLSSVQLNTRYVTEEINTFCSLTNHLEPSFDVVADLVYKYKDILFGYQTGFDLSRNRITKNNAGVSFNVKDTAFHFRCISIPTEFGLSAHRKINEYLDLAVNGIFAKRGSVQMWTLGIGAKYLLNDGSIFRCKVDKDLQIGVSLQQRLHEALNLTLSYNIDCANLQSGGHKAGLNLELEA